MQEIIDSFGLDWKIILAAVVNFLFVVWVINFFLNKKVFSTLEERKSKIKEGIAKFEESGKHLDDAKKESLNIIKKANLSADEKIQRAKIQAEEKKQDILNKAHKLSVVERDNLLQKAQEQKESIISEAKNDIAEIAILQAEKILSSK